MSEPLLRVENVGVTYGKTVALADVSLDLDRGGRLALIGESGSGKSTLAMAVAGLLPKQARQTGSIVFPGTVTVNFGINELTDLLKAAAKRAGADPTHASVSYTDEKTCSANITVKTKGGASGTIALGSTQLNETLAEELTSRGYTVAADGLRYSYSQGGFGNRSGTSVSVTLTAIPK